MPPPSGPVLVSLVTLFALPTLAACAQLVGFPDVGGDAGTLSDAAQRDAISARTDGGTQDAGREARAADGAMVDAMVDASVDAGAWSAPVTLATGQSHPAGIAMLQRALYWADEGDNTIRTATPTALDGGGAVAFPLLGPARELVTNGTNLYARGTGMPAAFMNTAYIVTPQVGPPDAAVQPLVSPIASTAIASTTADFFLAGTTGAAYCLGLTIDYGSSTTGSNWTTYTCRTDGPPLSALTVQGGTAFFGASSGPIYAQVGAQPTTSASYAPITTGSYQVTSIVADTNNVYWATTDGTIYGVSRQPDAGAPVTLATGQTNPAQLTTAAGDLYWTSSGDPGGLNGSVSTMPRGLTSTTPVVLASGQAFPFGITVDVLHTPNAVYWTNRDDGTVRSVSHL